MSPQERINRAVRALDTAIVQARDLSQEELLRKIQNDLREK